MRSPLYLLFSRLNRPSDLSCSLYVFLSRPFTIFITLLCTLSKNYCPLYCVHNCTQYSTLSLHLNFETRSISYILPRHPVCFTTCQQCVTVAAGVVAVSLKFSAWAGACPTLQLRQVPEYGGIFSQSQWVEHRRRSYLGFCLTSHLTSLCGLTKTSSSLSLPQFAIWKWGC